MRKIICVLTSSLCVLASAFAVPATPLPVLKTLPDGTQQEVYICGDEHFHYFTDLQGKRLPHTEIIDTAYFWAERITHNAPWHLMRNAYVPTTGTVHIPVVLVNFTDVRFSIANPQQQFNQFFNTTGGSNPNATGSVSSYYAASSDSALNLVFDVFGPYDLSNSMAYYGGNTSSSSMKNADRLVVEAATLASNAGVDFSKYDNDADGTIDNLSIVVAGYNEAEGGPEDAIWPHYSEVSSLSSFSGKRVRGYLMISEYRSSGGTVQAGIGTYCHEFGHALGLPDLYDTKNGDRYTVGTWDVMASGSYNNNGSTPPTYSAFERFAMGWLVPEQLKDDGHYLLPSIEKSNRAYLVASSQHNLLPLNPSPEEYFLIENRQLEGWDANNGALVGTGLLVSHITFSMTGWNYNTFNNNSILGYAIESALFSTQTYSSPADLFPGTGNVIMWKPTLNDGSQLLSQTLSTIVQLADGTVSFRYGMQTDNGLFFDPQTIDVLETTYDKQPVLYDTARISLKISDITTDTISAYTSNDNFAFSLDGGATWSSGTSPVILAVQQDTVYSIEVLVRYVPRRQSCSVQTGYLWVESSDKQFVNQIQLQGEAPRPTYIQAPILVGVQDVSSSAFSLLWEEQTDAEFYYLTLYSLQNTPSINRQGFDDFTSQKAIESAGWSANFVSTTALASEEGKALYFTQSGQQITTPAFPISPSKIRFWLSNLYVSSEEETAEGLLFVEAFTAAGRIDTISNVCILRTTKNLEKEFVLPQDSNYVQFRFSYTHIAGSGGMTMDGFVAELPKTIRYIYRGTDYEVYAPADRVIFSGLEPNTTYYCQVQAYEDKGCEAHYSELSAVESVTTLPAVSGDVILTIRRTEDGVYSVVLPEPADGKSTLYIYNAVGQLIGTQSIPYGTKLMPIPTGGMVKSNMYMLKVLTGKMTRKAAKGKMIYY